MQDRYQKRRRRKCPKCGKKGLFIKRSQEICLRCLHLDQGHKLIPEMGGKSRGKLIWNEDIDWNLKPKEE